MIFLVSSSSSSSSHLSTLNSQQYNVHCTISTTDEDKTSKGRIESIDALLYEDGSAHLSRIDISIGTISEIIHVHPVFPHVDTNDSPKNITSPSKLVLQQKR